MNGVVVILIFLLLIKWSTLKVASPTVRIHCKKSAFGPTLIKVIVIITIDLLNERVSPADHYLSHHGAERMNVPRGQKVDLCEWGGRKCHSIQHMEYKVYL